MRIWDLQPNKLCRQHLLGEHRELHAIWTYLTTNKGSSYRKHPETLRWEGKLKALFNRHTALIREMEQRGYNHHTPLDLTKVDLTGQSEKQDQFINTIKEQIENIKSKHCSCNV